mmetsp:Transcript_55785/g.82021  ORF Transcript_55785/g.82021 Transcript_55785/m.82021 type:complete len:265 (-) Transcript_55785:212-1006(-)
MRTTLKVLLVAAGTAYAAAFVPSAALSPAGAGLARAQICSLEMRLGASRPAANGTLRITPVAKKPVAKATAAKAAPVGGRFGSMKATLPKVEPKGLFGFLYKAPAPGAKAPPKPVGGRIGSLRSFSGAGAPAPREGRIGSLPRAKPVGRVPLISSKPVVRVPLTRATSASSRLVGSRIGSSGFTATSGTVGGLRVGRTAYTGQTPVKKIGTQSLNRAKPISPKVAPPKAAVGPRRGELRFSPKKIAIEKGLTAKIERGGNRKAR